MQIRPRVVRADGEQERRATMSQASMPQATTARATTFQTAISQITTSRWELPHEVERLREHGFDRLSLWRPKLSDVGPRGAAAILTGAGVRASSLQWAGGFTGGDGRSFRECVDDALEAIDDAAAVGATVVVVHSGCRGGHTRAHARRLLVGALETLAPVARSVGVTLALRPLHAAVAERCSFLARPAEALDVVEQIDDPAVRLAIDLWQFGDDPDLFALLPRLAASTAVVQVADRSGPPTSDLERRPAGRGGLPLERVALSLLDAGFGGVFEFDAVGDEVATLGYEAVLAETRALTDGWQRAFADRSPWLWASSAAPAYAPAWDDRRGQLRAAGSRRSHASSQAVSRG
jgi:sugar phosphate isomerase/epimerase